MQRTATVWAASVLILAAAMESRADATLAPAFASKISVDENYVSGLGQATDVAFTADGRAVVIQKTGEIIVRQANGATTTVPYPFGGTLDTSSEKGLLGVVADPRASANPSFFFYVSNGPTSDKHRVYHASLTAANAVTVDATPIIAAARGIGPGLEGPANHDGGGLFISGGKLFVSVGDTGFNATPPTNKYGSCLNKGNGKILRVNLDGTVPSDNPLVGLAQVSGCDSPNGAWTTAAPDPRVFVWGLRNPWRFWVDAQTARLWIGDVGESTSEEVSVTAGNQHMGYPFVEGDHTWGPVDGMTCTTLTPSRPCTPPAFAYPTAPTAAVTGGLIVSGCGWTNVFGGTYYVFADSQRGWIRALPVNPARDGFASQQPIDVATYSNAPVALRSGPDGALYVVLESPGAVHRFAPTALTGPDCTSTTKAVPATAPWMAGALALLLALAGSGLVRARRRLR